MDGARIRVVVLIPRYDNGGRHFKPALWRQWHEHLADSFGAFTRVEGTAAGVWLNEERVRYVDRSRVYLLALRSWHDLSTAPRKSSTGYRKPEPLSNLWGAVLSRWLAAVEFARQLFEQEAMNIEVAGVPEVVPPLR